MSSAKEAKRKALTDLRNINITGRWWDATCEQARKNGFNITVFDIEHKPMVTGHFIDSEVQAVEKMINLNKPGTLLHIIAMSHWLMENEQELKAEICEYYGNLLKGEHAFLMTDQAIIDTIKEKGFTFEVDGTLNNSK